LFKNQLLIRTEPKIKKAKKDKTTKSELKKIKEILKTNYDSVIDVDKITKAYSVDVKYRIIGEEDKKTINDTVILVKYNGIWKVANISKTPTYMSCSDVSDYYDDAYYNDYYDDVIYYDDY